MVRSSIASKKTCKWPNRITKSINQKKNVKTCLHVQYKLLEKI